MKTGTPCPRGTYKSLPVEFRIEAVTHVALFSLTFNQLFVLAALPHARGWGRNSAGPKNGSAAEATSVTRDGQVNLGKSVVMNLRQESCAIIESC